jgi:hypothetical protein
MNKLITLDQALTNTQSQLSLQSITQMLPQQLLTVLMKSILKRQLLSNVQRRNLLLKAIETSLWNSILLSWRPRCAEIGKSQGPASSATLVHLHTVIMSLSRRSTFHLTSRLRHAFSFMKLASVHMETDVSSCILNLAYSEKRRGQMYRSLRL